MSYGTEVTSSADGSLLISSDATSYAHYASVTAVQASATGVIAYVVWYELSAIAGHKPIYFIEINSQSLKPLKLTWDTNTFRWVLECIGDGVGYTNVNEFPKIHVFHSVDDMTLNSDTYGLDVYKANGDLTYTSRLESQMLKIHWLGGLNQAANFSTVANTGFSSGISRPALMYSTYFHGVNSISGSGSSWYNLYYCNGMLLGNSTTISSTLIGFGGFPTSFQNDQVVKYADTEYPSTSIISATDYD